MLPKPVYVNEKTLDSRDAFVYILINKTESMYSVYYITHDSVRCLGCLRLNYLKPNNQSPLIGCISRLDMAIFFVL